MRSIIVALLAAAVTAAPVADPQRGGRGGFRGGRGGFALVAKLIWFTGSHQADVARIDGVAGQALDFSAVRSSEM